MLHIAGIPQLPQTQEKHPYLSPESLAGAGNSSSSTLYSSTPSILMPRGHLLPTEVNVRQLQRLITKAWDLAGRSHQIVPAVKNADFNNKPDLIARMSSRLQEAGGSCARWASCHRASVSSQPVPRRAHPCSSVRSEDARCPAH